MSYKFEVFSISMSGYHSLDLEINRKTKKAICTYINKHINDVMPNFGEKMTHCIDDEIIIEHRVGRVLYRVTNTENEQKKGNLTRLVEDSFIGIKLPSNNNERVCFPDTIFKNGKYHPRDNYDLKKLCKEHTYIKLGDIDVSKVADFSFVFMNSERTNEEYEGIETWDVSNAFTLEAMFFGASNFNRDISAWSVGNVRNFSMAFMGASAFNHSLDSWDMSNAVDIMLMFCRAKSYTSFINSWNMPKLKNDCDVFLECPLEANKPSWAS